MESEEDTHREWASMRTHTGGINEDTERGDVWTTLEGETTSGGKWRVDVECVIL